MQGYLYTENTATTFILTKGGGLGCILAFKLLSFNMNVLSLFDGMSCGQIALAELGIFPDKYYASEIDKHAIGETLLNFPNTIQLGSVTEVDVSKLDHIDLLIGGSPCQSFICW